VSSDDDRGHVDGILIYRFIDGRPPRDREDWQRAVGGAWDAATCWTAEPDYAAGRLAELYDRVAVKPHDMGTDASNV
jgi:hypothetical protein